MLRAAESVRTSGGNASQIRAVPLRSCGAFGRGCLGVRARVCVRADGGGGMGHGAVDVW